MKSKYTKLCGLYWLNLRRAFSSNKTFLIHRDKWTSLTVLQAATIRLLSSPTRRHLVKPMVGSCLKTVWQRTTFADKGVRSTLGPTRPLHNVHSHGSRWGDHVDVQIFILKNEWPSWWLKMVGPTNLCLFFTHESLHGK